MDQPLIRCYQRFDRNESDILIGVNSFGQLTPSYPSPPENYTNLVGYAENMKMIDVINVRFKICNMKSIWPKR